MHCTSIKRRTWTEHWPKKTNLNGARFGMPSRDKVDTKATGRGTMAEVRILYESL